MTIRKLEPETETQFDPGRLIPSFRSYRAPVTEAIVDNARAYDPRDLSLNAIKTAVPAVLGLVMIWFGLTNTGSYYTLATRFSGGLLADVFYGWQLGTLIAIVGAILIYHSITTYK